MLPCPWPAGQGCGLLPSQSSTCLPPAQLWVWECPGAWNSTQLAGRAGATWAGWLSATRRWVPTTKGLASSGQAMEGWDCNRAHGPWSHLCPQECPGLLERWHITFYEVEDFIKLFWLVGSLHVRLWYAQEVCFSVGLQKWG